MEYVEFLGHVHDRYIVGMQLFVCIMWVLAAKVASYMFLLFIVSSMTPLGIHVYKSTPHKHVTV